MLVILVHIYIYGIILCSLSHERNFKQESSFVFSTIIKSDIETKNNLTEDIKSKVFSYIFSVYFRRAVSSKFIFLSG